MGALARSIYGLNDLLRRFSEAGKQPASAFCRIETAFDEHTLVMDDGSLLTVVSVSGILQQTDGAAFDSLTKTFNDGLEARFVNPGHVLQWFFESDPNAIEDDVRDAQRASRATAAALGMDDSKGFDETALMLSRFCTREDALAVLWTRPGVLSAAERSMAYKEHGKRLKEVPPGRDIQVFRRGFNELREPHAGYVQAFLSCCANGKVVADKIKARDLLREIRRKIDQPLTPRNWVVQLPGDAVRPTVNEQGAPRNDMSGFYWKHMRKQLFPREAQDFGEWEYLGGRLYAPIVVTLPPTEPAPTFVMLYRELLRHRIPWRCSFLVTGAGLDSLWLSSMFAPGLQFDVGNKQIVTGMKELEQVKEKGRAVVGFAATFVTWVETDDPTRPDVHAKLRQQTAQLVASLQQWGSSDASPVTGDALLGVMATIPAMMPTSPAPLAAAPLADIARMFPVTRPVSVWDQGNILFRSMDGKPLPYMQFSSKQASWIDVGAAPMGGGKSVLLNLLNYMMNVQAGLIEMPYTTVVDIGPSSRGAVMLLKAVLPPNKQHMANYFRLKMDKDHAINPGDTVLGAFMPLPNQLAFLVNLLTLLATPTDADAPPDSMGALARECLKVAYGELAPNGNPRVFNPHQDAELTELLDREGIVHNEETTWWDLVEAFFDKRMYHEATMAQRHAVPLLGDIAAAARKEVIRSQYEKVTIGIEPINEYFSRKIMEAIDAYPIFASPTKFDIGDTRFLALDLDEVAPKGGAEADRQTAIMFMLARHVGASRFFLQESDAQYIPPKYREYQLDRITATRRLPKSFCMDEVHRIARNSTVVKQFISDIEAVSRESRKWNIALRFFSQFLSDIPEAIVKLATAVYILGGSPPEEAKILQERLALNSAGYDLLMNLGQPGPQGANFLGVFTTSVGRVVQPMTLTLGQRMLWAFSSVREDADVRDALYAKFGVPITLDTITKIYPSGIKKVVEQRRAMRLDSAPGTQQKDVVQELIDELTETIHKRVAAGEAAVA